MSNPFAKQATSYSFGKHYTENINSFGKSGNCEFGTKLRAETKRGPNAEFCM